MGIKYMCDHCDKKEGIYEMPDGWYCLDCYSSHNDFRYEEAQDMRGIDGNLKA